MEKLVTKESLMKLLEESNKEKRCRIVGRALVVLHNLQTSEEQSDLTTKEYNNVGFTHADARSGTISARYYMKWGTLEDWQYKMWMKKNRNGVPRIVKYWNQLNVAANEKAAREKRQTRLI